MENFLDFFTVDVWTTVFTLVNMFIMLAIVKKLLFKPVMKILNDREAEVKRMYDDARQANEKATSMEKEYSEKMAQARNEAGEIIKQATLTAQRKRNYPGGAAKGRKYDQACRDGNSAGAQEGIPGY